MNISVHRASRHLVALLLLLSPTAWSAETTAASTQPARPGDKAYQEFLKSLAPPPEPKEPPTEELVNKYRKDFADRLHKGLELGDDFVKTYPDDPRVDEVRMIQFQIRFRLLSSDEDGRKELDGLIAEARKVLEAKPAPGPLLAGEAAYRIMQADLMASLKSLEREDAIKKITTTLKDYVEKYPRHPNAADTLATLAEFADRSGQPMQYLMYMDRLAKDFPEDPRPKMAQGTIMRKRQIGRPVHFEFTAIDGTKVDTRKMQGKVVLVEFWATWCGPCVMKMPSVLKLYEKYHPKGLEIVGISLDEKVEPLKEYVAKNKIPWAQCFDGDRGDASLARQWGITGIPAVMLLDQRGVLVTDSDEKADALVEKLLGGNTSKTRTSGPAPDPTP